MSLLRNYLSDLDYQFDIAPTATGVTSHAKPDLDMGNAKRHM